MFRLTREVRLLDADATSVGRMLRMQVTLSGALDPKTSYLRDIKEIDIRVRERIPLRAVAVPSARVAFGLLHDAFPGNHLDRITIELNPLVRLTQLREDYPMHTSFSRLFEFSAAHRLHNPTLSDDENRRLFGKCNNPHGHGHNYQMQVTLCGSPDESGLVQGHAELERIVEDHVLQKWDHKNLNVEVPEFRELIPSVENIAMVAYRSLKDRFQQTGAQLASVTVWETPKTWCEYSE